MKRWVAALAGALAMGAAADEDPRWYVQIDNDVVFATDRWYTSGVRFARVQRQGEHAMEWGVIQEVYTPESRYFEFGQVDRAPTARLQVSAARHDALHGGLQTLELRAGVRGNAALGERATAMIHHVIAAPAVDWSREVSTRADVQLAFVRTQPAGPVRMHYGAVVGNQVTFVHGGIELRAADGTLSEAYSPVLRHAATPPFDISARIPAGWNTFVGVSARVVARNALMDRGYDELAPDPERKRSVGRFALGLAGANGWGSIVLAIVQDTREFATQRTPHRFGALAVHVPF